MCASLHKSLIFTMLGPKVGGHLVPFLYSSCEPSELSQWLCYDDSTINAVLVIIIIIIIIITVNLLVYLYSLRSASDLWHFIFYIILLYIDF